MISVKQLLGQAGSLIKAHPVLLVPPVVADVLIAMTAPGRGPGGFGGLILGALIQLAIMAGWLSMIAKFGSGDKATWDDFFTSVGRHFWSMVGGGLNQVFALLALGFPLLIIGSLWVGQAGATRLEAELKPFLDGKADPAAIGQALSPEAMQAASQLTMLGLVWLLAFAMLSVLLVFWQQAVVLRHMGWVQAWRDSVLVVRRHLKPVLGLLTVLGLAQGGAIVLGLMLPQLGLLAGALGATLVLLVRVYASVATTLFYMETLKTRGDTPPSSPAPQA